MSSATSALEISCAKPECHWRGSPADAPGHTCPTPDPDAVGDPFAGMVDSSGAPLADTSADRSLPFWLVWTDGEEVRIVATKATEDEAIAAAQEIKPTRGELVVKPMPAAPVAEPVAEMVEIAVDADPQTREEIEAWLLEHGDYDDAGIPQDEKTATIDARLVALGEPVDETEPELDEIETTLEGEPVPEPAISVEEPDGTGGTDPAPATDAPRPWETVIAAALEDQTAVKEFRWLVVWKPEDETREAELIGRAKVKTEATVIAEDVEHRGQLKGPIEVVKTADVIAAAAEIEKKRELVEEPAEVVPASEPEPELEPEEPTPAEPKPDVAEAARRAQEAAAKVAPDAKGKALFDASDFDREDLALPKVDGHAIDRIAVGFSGEIMLDRSNPSHVALWRRMKLGREVEVWATVKGMGFSGTGATNREGDLDVVVGKRSVKVQSLRIIEPEQMEDQIRELALQARDANEAGEDGLEEVGGDA